MLKPTFVKRINPDCKQLAQSGLPYYTYLNPFPSYNYEKNSYGNCTWYAYGRFMELWDTASPKQKSIHTWKPWVQFKDAYKFMEIATLSGYKTGIIPKLGAIGCWAFYADPEGMPGHVAIVEDIMHDNQGNILNIEISHSGWTLGNLPNKLLYPGSSQIGTGGWQLEYAHSYFLGFIYHPIEFDFKRENNNYLDK